MMALRKNFPRPLAWVSFASALLLLGFPFAQAGEEPRRVVVISWDGLRPDMVTPANTPTLDKLRREGVFFGRHHAVYPTTTEVNGVALATGAYPENSGIVGNREYRPGINPSEPVATESLAVVRKGDELAGGKYLAVPTIYETLQSAGIPVAVAGTKPVALLANRLPVSPGSATIFQGRALPESLLPDIESGLGKFPEKPTFPDVAQNAWTQDALLGWMWKGEVPRLSLLWLSDPDYTQHDSQPGSEPALTSLRENDKLLAKLLNALDSKGLRETTDILVVSDHGFSTIMQTVDFAALLAEAGFRATRKFLTPPETGEILVVGSGGSVFFYVIGHDEGTTRRLVEFLQKSGLCSTLFSLREFPGTFASSTAHIASPEAPDVVAALRWNRSVNASGVPGQIAAEGGGLQRDGRGMHGSLSPFDLHNTLIAAGPDFRQGFVDDLPSGNSDVAPTVLSVLDAAPAYKMDGRVLVEALRNPPSPAPEATEKNLRATALGGAWSQVLKVSTVADTEYFDEGSPGTEPAAPQAH